MGNSNGKPKTHPHEYLLEKPSNFPVVHERLISDEAKCYHAEEIAAHSSKDYKIRDISVDPVVSFGDVCRPKNDDTYIPMYHVDTSAYSKLTGDVAKIYTWDKDKSKREPLYHLSESVATMKSWKRVRLYKEKDGECLYTIVRRFKTKNQYDIYPGEDEGVDDEKNERRLYMLQATDWKGNFVTLTNRDEEPILVFWTDVVQATTSFRCKIAPGIDHSLAVAFLISGRIQ
eukprot:GFYU01024952.1.p1 GENE.GFYU01024952.1~~GFYU01024952.1.p1  ORF type:complete len:230 (+),score=20.92 GFYU01024952.1:35-724(+)